MNYFKKLFTRNKEGTNKVEKRGDTIYIDGHKFTPLQNIMEPSEAMMVSTVFRCTTLIANNISTLPLQLFKRDKNGFGSPQPTNKVQRLLEYPNPLETQQKLVQKVIFNVIKKGAGFVEIIRNRNYEPIELRVADNVSIQESNDSYDLIYTVTDRLGIRTLASTDMIHITGVVPDRYGIGQSIFKYAAETLGLGKSAQNYLKAYFDNKMFADGILCAAGNLTEPQRAQIKEGWEAFKGLGNNLTPLLEGDVKYQALATSPNDTGAYEIRVAAIAEIARYFGVPLEKLNLKDKSQKVDAREDMTFYQDCLAVYIKQLEQELSKKLFFVGGGKYFVKFDTSHYTQISKEMAETKSMLIQNAIMTPNEVRFSMNLPPVEFGDKVYLNYISLENNDEHFGKGSESPTKQKINDNDKGNKKPDSTTDSE